MGQNTHERIREGVAIAKREGKYKGRKKSLTLVQVEEIQKLVTERYKITEIAKKFNISRDTVYRYLRLKTTK